MGQGQAIKKVPGGKLLRVEITYSERIETVKITGDFFLHPEELLPQLETALNGISLPTEAGILACRLEAILEQHEAQLIGATAADIADTLMEALA